MTLEEVPIWEAPHRFSAEVGEARRRVFSYGLLLPELRSVRHADGRAYLASRWGDLEVDELAKSLHGFVQPESETWTHWAEERARTTFGRELSALTKPEFDQIVGATDELRSKLETEEIGPLVAPRDERLDGLTRLRPLDRGLARFIDSLQQAADTRARVPDGFEDDMRRFLDEVRRPDTFGWMYRRRNGERQRVRVPRYDGNRLHLRLAIEFDQLVSLQPRLSRCVLCRRCFVPRRPARPEAHCCGNLWLLTDPPRQLERCVAFDEAERLKTRQRLYGRVYRARQRHGQSRQGEKHPDVVKAKRELSEWLKANPPRRKGRQPEPTRPDLIPEPEPKGE